ncbi:MULTISPECIES: hypothetical protein [Streptomyces]|uniref:Uncharacterized protein n=2 Tax=Streptomyces TaxID=1883 RepID=A0ABV9IXB3_9ACTN
MHVLGETVLLRDGREVCFALEFGPTADGFSVESEVTVDDEREESGARPVLELPETRGETLQEGLAALTDHARRLAGAGPGILRQLVREEAGTDAR